MYTTGSAYETTVPITYLIATGMLSMSGFRSWMTHFLITLNNIYLPSNVLMPTPNASPSGVRYFDLPGSQPDCRG